MNIIAALIMWIVLVVIRTLFIIIGIFWVPFCLINVKIPSGSIAGWRLIRLPWWGHPWDNPRDGVLGDRRLDYWTNGTQYPQWFDNYSFGHYLKSYYWLTIRNPANNLSRYYRGFGCKIDECKVILLGGQDFVSDTKKSFGWQFVRADGPKFKYWGLYLVKPFIGKHLDMRIGHKVEPRYADYDFSGDNASKAWKGFTFRLRWRNLNG